MDVPGLSFDLATLDDWVRPDPAQLYDVLILGGGPAAMSAAVYAARKMLKTALLTKDLGGQVGWTSEIENYLGFQTISGKQLVERFKEQVRQFNVPIAQGERVLEVSRPGELFEVRLESGALYRSQAVIAATGKRNRKLGAPGEDEFLGRGVAICAICDAPFYRGRDVVVAGGGNSAFTAALDLLKVEARPTLVNVVRGWQADGVLQEALGRAGARAALLDRRRILAIRGDERVRAVDLEDLDSGARSEIATDGVFIEIGLEPNSAPLARLARLTAHDELMIDCRCRTDVPFLYGAGDVTTVPYKQIVVSAGEGAKAALSAHEDLLMAGRI